MPSLIKVDFWRCIYFLLVHHVTMIRQNREMGSVRVQPAMISGIGKVTLPLGSNFLLQIVVWFEVWHRPRDYVADCKNVIFPQ